ncbi:MAG TPA: D-alanyl-D-alanine carboxypeptidase family protein [Ktedonobacterales bacterium]|nr:D-alanyl-D-alanine carboxypeptidase family protein [Ktedonobacterales bacterium]
MRADSARYTDRPESTPVSWRGTAYAIITILVLLGAFVALVAQMSALAGSARRPNATSANVAGSTLNLLAANAPKITATAAYVFDANTGAVLYSKDADAELPMASCTKVMTALLAVEHGNLDQVITVGADAHKLVGPDSSYMGLGTGEKLTLRDLLYGLVMPSGNDAAVAIADGIAGTTAQFVAMMNERAAQLGLTHTHFANPHGLDAPGHYTSARDLAVLSAVVMKNPTLVTIMSAHSYDIPKTTTHKAYHLVSGNDLLAGSGSPYPGAIGVKPGYTGPAGFCQSFAAIRHGHLIVGSVLHDPSWQVRRVDMRRLLDWGFEQEGIPAAPPPTPGSTPPND